MRKHLVLCTGTKRLLNWYQCCISEYSGSVRYNSPLRSVLNSWSLVLCDHGKSGKLVSGKSPINFETAINLLSLKLAKLALTFLLPEEKFTKATHTRSWEFVAVAHDQNSNHFAHSHTLKSHKAMKHLKATKTFNQNQVKSWGHILDYAFSNYDKKAWKIMMGRDD